MDPDSWRWAGLVICLIVAALASLAETSITSVSRIRIKRLQEAGSQRAAIVSNLLANPGLFFSTILIVNSLALIAAASLATIIALHYTRQWGDLVATVLLTVVVLVFAELTPKTLAIAHAERVALFIAPGVQALATILTPIIVVLNWFTGSVARLLGQTPAPRGPFVNEEELRMLVAVSEEQGVIEEEEKEMIHSIFEFSDTAVREVMVPRVDVVAAEVSATPGEVIDLMLKAGHSRIPIYQGSIDEVVGVAYDRDLLKYLREGSTSGSLRELCREPMFVPESKKVDELLREFQRRKVHLAIVVDEFGGTAGIVTIEDLLEEIVGEIQDEYDEEEEAIQLLSPDEAVVNATVSLGDINDQLELDLRSEDADTLGGYVYQHLSEMPAAGDEFQADGAHFSVLSTHGRRVKKVRVRRLVSSGTQSEQ